MYGLLLKVVIVDVVPEIRGVSEIITFLVGHQNSDLPSLAARDFAPEHKEEGALHWCGMAF